IQRFKSWIHVNSSQSALGRSLCCYGVILALLIAASYCPEPPLWAPAANASFDAFAPWQGFDGRLLVANAMAAGFAAIAMPPLYLARRVQLYRWNKQQI